jgi:hypothetical protein
MIVSRNSFLYFGLTMVSKDQVDKRKEFKKKLEEKFRGSFGISSHVTSILFEYLHAYNADNNNPYEPKHLLWALLFMKIYATEAVLTQITGVSEKTLRGKVWMMIDAISMLYEKVVRTTYCH